MVLFCVRLFVLLLVAKKLGEPKETAVTIPFKHLVT
jgi:hypothetical protein